MRPDRDPDRERADLFSDVLGDDSTLRRVVSDLDTLYNERRQPPARLLLPQEWATATMRQAADQCERDPARPAAELPNASRRSMRGAPMFTGERSVRPRRMHVFAATAAALVIVGLLGFLLTRGTPTKQTPAGSSTSSGDAAVLQQFATQGGANLLLDYQCPQGASPCDESAKVSQLESIIRKRLEDAGIAKAVFFQQIDSETLSLLIPGVKDETQAPTLVSDVGQVNIIDTGATQLPVGTLVRVCAASATNCPAGSYHVAFTGQQIDPSTVSAGPDPQTNLAIVTFTFKADARSAFASYTSNHVGEYLTITLDNQVIESATIQSEIDGQAQIFGISDIASAHNLAAKLKDGPLPLEIVIESHQIQAPLSCPPTTASQPLGVPAITPRIAHPATGQPAYTAADARAYVEAHMPGSHTSIVAVYQLSALQAAVLFDFECTGLPDDHPVVVVQLTGDFGPIGAPSLPQGPIGTHYAAETFDGVTGNLIMTTNLPK